jgi:cephalosporin hydroxylase
MIASLKGKLWLTYCAWFRQPLEEKLRKDFSTQLPPWNEFHAEVADFLASTGQSNVPMRELYILVRGLKPEMAVETGVARGGSTATILAAMDKNQKGELHSIDATKFRDPRENDGYTPEMIGTIMRIRQHPRWHFHEGFSQEVLPRLAREFSQGKKSVGLFIHDSDHSAKCIQFELFEISPIISPGGFVASHDAFSFGNKPAFRAFERQQKDFRLYFEGKGNEYRIYRKGSR